MTEAVNAQIEDITAKETMMRHLMLHWDNKRDHINRLVDKLKISDSNLIDVNSLMRIKRNLMIVQSSLPLGRLHCYFCNKNQESGNITDYDLCADRCEYAKVHGICNESGSVYGKVETARQELQEEVYNYYKGDNYEELPKS